jgi:hypothetical protein
MNKFSKIVAMMFCVAVAANAQIKGIGYDAGALKQITARLPLGANFLDVGAGVKFDNGAPDDNKFGISVSGFFLGHLHDFGPVDTYFTAGGFLAKLAQEDDNIAITGFAGFQPEVTLLDHIVLSTRIGLSIPLMPDFGFETSGNAISIVEGANFKILF